MSNPNPPAVDNPMNRQVTRDNHYVPKWYQKGFLLKDRHKLHVRNLHPTKKILPNGKAVLEPEVEELGPKQAFMALDLYTTKFGDVLNDDIETFLFGRIDKSGADAVRGWIAGDPIQVHKRFLDFFGYMDAQKLRTPKGLDWIIQHYKDLPQVALMSQMQALRLMHCTMWSECVREIVSAAKSPVKFLVSDHPVTLFNPKLGPDTDECQYPSDPGVQMVGTQTIFVLDANHCLILSNLEYAEAPKSADHLARRTNARFRGQAMANTEAMVRGRELSEEEVNAINLVLLTRAKQFVAAGRPEWLYPERTCKLSWEEIAKVLLPRDGLWKFGGETYIGYKDGTTAYRDKYGRSSRAHEFLSKPERCDPEESAPCGCGGGRPFRDCCADIPPRMRPTWRSMSIRERNLTLIRGITEILNIDGTADSWLRVRRTFSDDQVREIYELHAALWPLETQLIDLLPSPQHKRSRALFMGMNDAGTLSENVISMLAYVDEIVVVHPFMNANSMRKEFSPIHHPEKYHDQTLRNVFTLLVLEQAIWEGRVHLVPDPLDFDPGFRSEIMAIAESNGNAGNLGPLDEAKARELGQDRFMRFVKRLPPDQLKVFLSGQLPPDTLDGKGANIDSIVKIWGQEVARDHLALLTPPPLTGQSGEFMTLKSFARETGLYVATLMGAFVYTDSDTQWDRLHESDGVHSYAPDPAAELIIGKLEHFQIEIPPLGYQIEAEPKNASTTCDFLRKVSSALRVGASLDFGAELAEPDQETELVDAKLPKFRIRASIPIGGFQRTDVSRLVMTFGRLEDVTPVRLALFIGRVSPTT